jgi:ketosteroid isomerase-like protein
MHMVQEISRHVLEAWIAGFRKEDATQLAGLFADDAIFSDPRYPPLTGKPAIAAYYQHLLAETTDWGSTTFEGPYLLGGDCFAVQCVLKFTWRENGITIDWPFAAFFKARLSDGKLVRYNEYWDTDDTLKKLGIASWGPVPGFVTR